MNNQNDIFFLKKTNANKMKIESYYQVRIPNHCLGINSILSLVTNMYILV
jgi:hypothetical protein